MKGKAIALSIAGAALAASLLAYETGNARKTGSGTTRVFIDGSTFIAAPSSDDGYTLRQELSRLGVEPPDGIESLYGTAATSPVFSEKLVASREPRANKGPRVPEGLSADHALRMSGGDGTVELVLGRIEGGSGTAAAHLEADRWTRAEADGGRGLPKILRKNRGKETDIVCLDEGEGIFLLVRRLER